ncbi:peptide methionine sulfoxide reductase [Vibrio nigripulchritudo ATCC 27043]|uniref:peptide-methionine (S)-S-oxide reductase MsrA n=1 Tax=Vibrio nigripulchritudo TaxID=28173 RepID=UPI00021C1884|nr:peptide-methionine (S)-S-oxide reductase MsrA [Vibrio nigripulchritudo]EGU57589.1 peptide methionine sulfoxide reductase [Vibrio nigripulchritudo ATCC 27043]
MTLSLATIGGGCFWCTEALFQQVRGVKSVTSGYSGGHTKNPAYREVCNGTTGHAEVVQIEFDDSEISFADLVEIHLTTHNPTTPDRQGADRGTQYRSIILGHDESQLNVAKEVIEKLKPEFSDPIVTEVKPFEVFYKAEGKHQNYYRANPEGRYCQMVISPKLDKFRVTHGDKLS